MGMLAEKTSLRKDLAKRQNADGGWGYGEGGTSWTEPTAFALLALASEQGCEPACLLASQWLRVSQRPDGGWAPQHGVLTSTWVTSLATLALLDQSWQKASRDRALRWLTGQAKPASSVANRLIARFTGELVQPDTGLGTPWFPGTSGWLYPTAFSVLTFQRAALATGNPAYRDLGRQGQEYILSRRCRDGGWNHGGSHFLSEDAPSYPEMTGVALLALGGVPEEELFYPLKRAEGWLKSPNSVEGLSWVQMGLAKHHWLAAGGAITPPSRTTRDIALRLLAINSDNPRNSLVASH